MNTEFLISKLTGKWITQNTGYSLIRYSEHIDTSTDQVSWTYVKNPSPCLKSAILHLKQSNKLSEIDLYHIRSKNNRSIYSEYYVLSAYQASELRLLIKLSSDFVFLNKFIVQSYSQKQLTISSYDKNIEIIEKIYFLNRNLKVIKSTIRKHDSCIGISFSSEIRIG